MSSKVRAMAIATLAAAMLAAAGGCRQTDIRTARILVPNVWNEACEARVREALRPLKGVQMDTIEIKDGVLVARYDSMMLGLKNLEHAIKDAGFDANEFEGDPKARARLPKECLEKPAK
jgi:copper chaperone CopZ